jgi:integrase
MSEYRIGRLNGGFVVTWWKDGKRRRYRLAALTRKDAESEAIDRIRRETITPEVSTVATLWEAYRVDRKGRSVAETMRYTGLPICNHFGALRPDQITTAHCRAYAATRKKAGIKTGSVWTELGHLRTVLSWAAQHNLIAKAPAIERPSKPAPKERFLTSTEIERLLAADCEPHIKTAIHLMLKTAGRVGAVLDLKWDRVDIDRGQINLRADAEGPRKGRATVPMNDSLRAVLAVARDAALTDYVIEWAGGPVKSIRKGFASAVANAGLSGVSPHVLRHTAAVHMVAGGVPMSRVAQYLGHSSTSITERVYGRFSPDHLRDAAEILDFGKALKVR